MIHPSSQLAVRPTYRETPCGSNHPLTAAQLWVAIQHAQRQGEPCYALAPAFATGATTAVVFTTQSNLEQMMIGAEPWPSSFQPGLHPGSSRIFSITSTGLVCEVFRMRF